VVRAGCRKACRQQRRRRQAPATEASARSEWTRDSQCCLQGVKALRHQLPRRRLQIAHVFCSGAAQTGSAAARQDIVAAGERQNQHRGQGAAQARHARPAASHRAARQARWRASAGGSARCVALRAQRTPSAHSARLRASATEFVAEVAAQQTNRTYMARVRVVGQKFRVRVCVERPNPPPQGSLGSGWQMNGRPANAR